MKNNKNKLPTKRYSESQDKYINIGDMHDRHLIRAINKCKKNNCNNRVYDAMIIEAYVRDLIDPC